MLRQRRSRPGERGQVLIMALAFIAFFGLVTVAVLKMAATVFLAQSSAQIVTGEHNTAQGAALFAAADAVQRSLGSPPGGSCVAGSTAQVSMQGGSTVGYTTVSCNPGATADILGDQCTVCVLGSANIGGSVTARNGPMVFNSNPSGDGTATSTISVIGGANPGFVGCAPGSGCLGGGFGFNTTPAQLTQAVSASPPTPPAQGGGCPPFNPDSNTMIPPGTYSCGDVDLDPGATYTLSGGVYIFEAMFKLGTGTTVTWDHHHPVLLYFTGDGQLELDSGSSLDVIGGVLSGSGPVITGGTLPASDLVVYFDPNDSCSSSGQQYCITILDGALLTAHGTVYLPPGSGPGSACVLCEGHPSQAGGMDIAPIGSSSPSGALVAGDLRVASLGSVTVVSHPPSQGYCFVYDDATWWASSSSSPHVPEAHVVVATNCNGGSGIVDIDYGS